MVQLIAKSINFDIEHSAFAVSTTHSRTSEGEMIKTKAGNHQKEEKGGGKGGEGYEVYHTGGCEFAPSLCLRWRAIVGNF